jgi:hypothetical protein
MEFGYRSEDLNSFQRQLDVGLVQREQVVSISTLFDAIDLSGISGFDSTSFPDIMLLAIGPSPLGQYSRLCLWRPLPKNHTSNSHLIAPRLNRPLKILTHPHTQLQILIYP